MHEWCPQKHSIHISGNWDFSRPAKYERFSCTGGDTDGLEKEVRRGSENYHTNMSLKMRRQKQFFSKYKQYTMASQ